MLNFVYLIQFYTRHFDQWRMRLYLTLFDTTVLHVHDRSLSNVRRGNDVDFLPTEERQGITLFSFDRYSRSISGHQQNVREYLLRSLSFRYRETGQLERNDTMQCKHQQVFMTNGLPSLPSLPSNYHL